MQKPHPTPTLAGAAPGRAAPAKDLDARFCKRCRKHSPLREFMLLDRKEWPGVRTWCGNCLAEQGHVTRQQLEGVRRRHAKDLAAQAAAHAELVEQQAAEEAGIDVHERRRRAGLVRDQNHVSGLALKMHDLAANDPAYAAALRLAVSALDVPREDLAALAGQP